MKINKDNEFMEIHNENEYLVISHWRVKVQLTVTAALGLTILTKVASYF